MVERKGTALLMVFVDIDSEHDADFNAWYNDEHVGDLMKFPGFLNFARYQALKGGPRYLAMYELPHLAASHRLRHLLFNEERLRQFGSSCFSGHLAALL